MAGPGEAEDIGDQRVFADRLQAQGLAVQDGVAQGGDEAAVPAVAGDGGERRVGAQCLGADGEVHRVGLRQLRELGRRALVDLERDPGIGEPEGADHRRQDIAGLGVGGADPQHALGFVHMVPTHREDVLPDRQRLPRIAQDLLPGGGEGGEALALTDEEPGPELRLQAGEVLGHGGLHQMQPLRRLAHVESGLHCGHQGPELPQLHDCAPYLVC